MTESRTDETESTAPAEGKPSAAPNGVGPRKKPLFYRLSDLVRALAGRSADSKDVKAIYGGRLEPGFREKLMVSVAFQNLAPH